MYKNPELPEIFPGETHIEIKQHREKIHRKKEVKAGVTHQVHEAVSSSSQDTEWKMWGKTGPL